MAWVWPPSCLRHLCTAVVGPPARVHSDMPTGSWFFLLWPLLLCVWSAAACSLVVIEAIHTPWGPPYSSRRQCSRGMDLAVIYTHMIHLVGHSTDSVIHSHLLLSPILLATSHHTTSRRHLRRPCSPSLQWLLLVWIMFMSPIVFLLSMWASSRRQGPSSDRRLTLRLLHHICALPGIASLITISLISIHSIRSRHALGPPWLSQSILPLVHVVIDGTMISSMLRHLHKTFFRLK